MQIHGAAVVARKEPWVVRPVPELKALQPPGFSTGPLFPEPNRSPTSLGLRGRSTGPLFPCTAQLIERVPVPFCCPSCCRRYWSNISCRAVPSDLRISSHGKEPMWRLVVLLVPLLFLCFLLRGNQRTPAFFWGSILRQKERP